MKKNSYPLRKIVDTFADEETGALKERLECGHIIGVKKDIYGHTTATKRRCWKCGKETGKET